MKQQLSIRAAIGIDDRPLMWIGIPVLSFLIPLLLFGGTLSNGLLDYLPKWGVSFVYTISYWLVCRRIFIVFRRRYPYASQTTQRLLYTGLYLLLAFFSIELILGIACRPLMEQYAEQEMASRYQLITGSFLIVALVSTIYESVYFYQNWKQTLLEAEQLRREQVESQLEGLKSQVNPHFLFNSLNTLSYLIPEDEERAVQFVQKLSRVYRYILEMRDKKLVSLEDELQFLRSYTFLVQERFADNLKVEVDVPAGLRQRKMVPLALQLLMENAIKHNVISQLHPMCIRIYTEDEKLCVANQLQRKRQVSRSTGLGLENIKNRYSYFTDERVQVEEKEGKFLVCLPLL
jgi:two-component system, LytTR family, sensor kinase